jgi:hypothetical protein
MTTPEWLSTLALIISSGGFSLQARSWWLSGPRLHLSVMGDAIAFPAFATTPEQSLKFSGGAISNMRLGLYVIQPSGRAGAQNYGSEHDLGPPLAEWPYVIRRRCGACAKPKQRTYEIAPHNGSYANCEARTN